MAFCYSFFMYYVSDMPPKTVISEILLRVPFLFAALRRETMILTRTGSGFKFTEMGGGRYQLNLSDPENLEIFDRTQMPYLATLLKRADHLGIRTAAEQLLKPQGVLAIELESVSALTFNELSDRLHFRNGAGVKAAEKAPSDAVVVPFPGLKRA